MQRVSKRRLNGTDSSAPAVRAAPASPEPARTGLLEPVTASVAGPGRSDRSPNRSEPASCLVFACVHLVQGGARAAQQQLSRRQRAVERVRAGQRKGGASGFWGPLHRLRQHTQLLPVCQQSNELLPARCGMSMQRKAMRQIPILANQPYILTCEERLIHAWSRVCTHGLCLPALVCNVNSSEGREKKSVWHSASASGQKEKRMCCCGPSFVALQCVLVTTVMRHCSETFTTPQLLCKTATQCEITGGSMRGCGEQSIMTAFCCLPDPRARMLQALGQLL